jgi:hypothetical protein
VVRKTVQTSNFAPRRGFEPRTFSLTGSRSTVELSRNIQLLITIFKEQLQFYHQEKLKSTPGSSYLFFPVQELLLA